MQNESEKSAAGDGMIEFIQRRRKPLFVSAGLILLLLIAFIAALSLMDILNGKAISAVEELNSRYEALQPSITEDYTEVDVERLLADLQAFAQKNTGYAGGRAWSIIAAIHGEKQDWAAAEAAWASAAKTAKKTYLVPLAWFNAGAAAEEQGRLAEAIEYYSSSLEMASDFPGAPRAQFAIGRLQESLGEHEAAIEAYRAVISTWTYDKVWTNLAHNRIIALETGEE